MNIGAADFKQLMTREDLNGRSLGASKNSKVEAKPAADFFSTSNAKTSSPLKSNDILNPSQMKRDLKPKNKTEDFSALLKDKTDDRVEDKSFGRWSDKFENRSDEKAELKANDSNSSYTANKDTTKSVSPKNLPRVSAQNSPVQESERDVSIADPAVAKDDSKIVSVAPANQSRVEMSSNQTEDDSEVAPEEQYAMMKFLVAMKTELGVEPQEIVQAMASLDGKSLESSASSTAHDVIERLNLPPNESIRAEELYENMLRETAEARMGNWLEKQNQKVDMKVLGPDQLREQKTLTAIDDMNRKFFPDKMNRVQPQQGNPQSDASSLATPLNDKKSDETKLAPVPVAASLPEESTAAVPVSRPAAKAYGLKSAPSLPLATSSESFSEALKQSNAGSEGSSPQGSPVPANFQVPTNDNINFANSTSLVAPASGEAVMMAAPSKDSAFSGFSDSQNKGDRDSNDGSEILAPGIVNKNEQNLTLKDQQPVVFGSQAKSTDVSANVRQLINTAHVLVQRGGGEMKVQLRPDGLGTVDLKVNVKDGKVDIQMLTQSSEAKRVLESGLDDLRSSLVQHKLNLDSVKVDSSGKGSSDMSSGFMNGDREGAREFLGQFRDYNNSQRNAFFDFDGPGKYAGSSRKMNPEPTTTNKRARTSDRRLDLVA